LFENLVDQVAVAVPLLPLQVVLEPLVKALLEQMDKPLAHLLVVVAVALDSQETRMVLV
jgi:hypothetical protein